MEFIVYVCRETSWKLHKGTEIARNQKVGRSIE